jgi:ribosomal protein S12 methylthiotransferase
MKFYIDQFGCAKNQVDGEEILARLEAQGHSYVPSSAEADLIIVNTCGFIEDAKKESIAAVLNAKAANPDKKILVAGCLAQRYSEALLNDMQEVDGVFGNADLSKIGEAFNAIDRGERRILIEPQPAVIDAPYYPRTRRLDFPGTAYVKITEGCDNLCSYCAIPLIRGRLRSRPIRDIVQECESLLAQGVKELILIGQDLGSYGNDLRRTGSAKFEGSGLAEILNSILKIEADFRLRILYIHPDHFPFDILPLMKQDPRILPYFDIPFQHASERILASMNRKGSAELYLSLLDRIREAIPDAMVRSTFLVGFPGETEDDFQTLLDFQDKASLDWLGAFAYSREEDTKAFGFKGRVKKSLALSRKKKIEEQQISITAAKLDRFVGRTIDILIEEKVEGANLSLGRGWMQAPDIDGLTVVHGTHEPGTFVACEILKVNGVDLEAQPLASHS